MAGKTSYQDYVNAVEAKPVSYDDYKSTVNPPDQTLEEKYLDPYVYPAMDTAMKGVAAAMKPMTAMATPILESARYGVRKLSGQGTGDIDLNSDLKSVQNPHASASGLMEDSYNAMGIKQNNLADSGLLPDYMRDQFPKAYKLLGSLRPSDVAAMPVDAMLYGKFAAPAGMEAVASTSEGIDNLFNKQKLAKNILKAGSTDPGLLNDLHQTGKINSVAQRIIDDPSLNRVDRSKVLEEINGSVTQVSNEHGVDRFTRRGGQLSNLNREQSNFVESLPQDEYSFDSMGTNLRAKELLDQKGILSSTKSAAAKKIDEMIPFNQMEGSELDTINRRTDISKQLDDVNQAVDSQKMEELSKLSKAQQEALAKKESIPFFQDNPDRVPARTEYVTSNRYSSPESMNQMNSEVNHKTYIPPVGDEQVWNKSGAQDRMGLVKQIEDIQNQIDTLSGTGYRNHPVMKSLVEKRDSIANEFWDLQDKGFPSRDAYAEHIDGLNQRPIQEANDIRLMANRYKSGLSKGTEEYSVAENAANATEQATREAMDNVISSMPKDQSDQYYQNQSKISDLMNVNDLYSGTYAKKSGQPNLPIGGMVRGAAREAINLKGQYVDPHLLDVANKYNLGNGAESSFPRQGTPMQQGNSAATLLAAKYSMGKGLVMNLADYQIPRNTTDILNNKQSVIAKVAQTTNDPKVVSMLEDALNTHPEKLETVLPVIVKMFPNLFESDKYDRIDNKIMDPMIRQKAYQDVENSGLSNTQKVMLQNGLNRDGTLKGF